MPVRIWRNWTSQRLHMGLYDGTATLENRLAVSYKTKHFSAVTLLSIYPREMKTMFTQKLFTNVHSRFIWNSQNLEATHMFFSGWTVKQTVAHPFHEMLLSNKKDWTAYMGQPGWIFQRIRVTEKSQSQKIAYYVIPFI